MGKDNKVVRAITGVTCVMLVAKALGMLRSILQARVYGAGPDVDLFTQASNYTVSVFTTVCYALCVAAIPLLTQTLLRSREAGFRAANKLISNTLVLALIVAAGATALTGAGLTQQLLGVEDGTGVFRFSFTVLLWALPVIALTYLLLALFQSMGHFTLQGSLSLLYGLVLCAVLLIFGERLSLRGFVVLTSAGWLLQLLMTVPAIKKERYRFRFTPDLRWPEYRAFLRTGAATVFNSSLLLLCYLVNTRFAAAGPEGTLSAFFYANKLYEPLTTTLIYSVSIVLFPKFSQQYEQMEASAYRQYVVHVLKNTLLLVLPISLLFSAFGTPVIRVLFEGGSFTGRDAVLCGGIFSMYALGMAGFFMLDILNKAYYAMGKTLVPLCVTAGTLAVNLLLNALCANLFPQRPELLALGTSVGFLLGGSLMYMGFARTEGVQMPRKQLFWGVLSALVMGAAAFWIYDCFLAAETAKLMLVVKCCGVGLAGMVLYLLCMGPMVPTREILSKLRGQKK
jgi:murein biosynthesis integral membrane protein MurJ